MIQTDDELRRARWQIQVLTAERDAAHAALLGLVSASPETWRDAHLIAQGLLGVTMREPPCAPLPKDDGK